MYYILRIHSLRIYGEIIKFKKMKEEKISLYSQLYSVLLRKYIGKKNILITSTWQ